MKGTATISLDDLDALRKAADAGTESVKLMKEVDSEVSFLLKFLSKNSDMELIAGRFNAQSPKSFLKEVSPGTWALKRRGG